MSVLEVVERTVDFSHESELSDDVRPRFDRDALEVLEALSLSLHEDVMDAFDEFLAILPLFSGITNFALVAAALDSLALAFSAIDTNHDALITRKELEAYVAQCGPHCPEYLNWVVMNFPILEQMSLFVGNIARDEIELARDVFHGLSYLQRHIDEIRSTRSPNHILSANDIADYLTKHKSLELHDARGLAGLGAHLKRLECLQHLDNPITQAPIHSSLGRRTT